MVGDIKMNELPVTTGVKYVYVEKSDGSQGKVASENFLNAIKLYNQSVEIDCNEIKANCIIPAYRWKNAPGNTIAILETIMYNNDWIIQRFTLIDGEGMYIRRFYNSTTWSEWKLVTLT